MKINRHTLRKYLIIIACIAICFLCVKIVLLGEPDRTQQEGQYSKQLPVPLNQLLVNDLSEVKGTEDFDKRVLSFMRKWEIEGASLAVMKDEKLIYAKGYGIADETTNDSMEVRHIMRIASVSKLITAVGIMKLEEDGKLSLDDKVFGTDGILNDPQFQDIYDKRAKKITVEQLLRHQGGFSLRRGDPMFSTPTLIKWEGWECAPDTDQMIRYVLSQGLGFTPGQSTSYSNVGYLILSRIIEKVSGRSYEDFIQEEVLYPCGCYDFHLAHNYYEDKYENEVKYHEPSNEPLVEHFDGSGRMVQRCYGGNNIEALLGAGGWVASPVELLKFVASIDGSGNIPDILSKESIEKMTKSDEKTMPIGWAKTNSDCWLRTGSLSGSSAIIKKQSNGYTWAFITNTSSWKGSRFPAYVDGMVFRAKDKVEKWPGRNLFDLQ